MIDAASIAPPFRLASEYVVVLTVDGIPVAGSIWRSLIPDQKDPNASQGVQFSSKLKLGSIALKSSVDFDCTTRPSSVHAGALRDVVVARPMTELFEPKVDPA